MNQPPTSEPSTSTAGGPLPAVRTGAGASGGQLGFLALSVVLFVLIGVVPVVVLLSLAGALVGSISIAELLEQSRGLAPTTYGGAFWLAVAFTVVMAVIEVRAILRGKKEGQGLFAWLLTRPLIGLFVLFGLTRMLVRIDAKIDVPDVLTTTLLLCCLGCVYFILPLAIIGWAFRLVRWMWRTGRSSGFASGALGVLGLAIASCLPAVCATRDDVPHLPPEVSAPLQRGIEEARDQGPVDGSLALLSELSAVEAGHKGKERFDECVETLFAGGFRSVRNEKVESFTRRGMDVGLAEDVVQHAIIDLCLHYGKAHYDDLVRAFHRRANQRRINERRRQGVRDGCAVLVESMYYAGTNPEASTVESQAIDRALCSLEEQDRDLLRLDAFGDSAKEIGEKLGMTAENVRQRKGRILAGLRKQLKLH